MARRNYHLLLVSALKTVQHKQPRSAVKPITSPPRIYPRDDAKLAEM